MNLTVFFAPTDVSLYRVEIEEVGEDATDISGVPFLGHPPEHHTSDEFRGLNDGQLMEGSRSVSGRGTVWLPRRLYVAYPRKLENPRRPDEPHERVGSSILH